MIAYTVFQLQNTWQRQASEQWIRSAIWEDGPIPPAFPKKERKQNKQKNSRVRGCDREHKKKESEN